MGHHQLHVGHEHVRTHAGTRSRHRHQVRRGGRTGSIRDGQVQSADLHRSATQAAGIGAGVQVAQGVLIMHHGHVHGLSVVEGTQGVDLQGAHIIMSHGGSAPVHAHFDVHVRGTAQVGQVQVDGEGAGQAIRLDHQAGSGRLDAIGEVQLDVLNGTKVSTQIITDGKHPISIGVTTIIEAGQRGLRRPVARHVARGGGRQGGSAIHEGHHVRGAVGRVAEVVSAAEAIGDEQHGHPIGRGEAHLDVGIEGVLNDHIHRLEDDVRSQLCARCGGRDRHIGRGGAAVVRDCQAECASALEGTEERALIAAQVHIAIGVTIVQHGHVHHITDVVGAQHIDLQGVHVVLLHGGAATVHVGRDVHVGGITQVGQVHLHREGAGGAIGLHHGSGGDRRGAQWCFRYAHVVDGDVAVEAGTGNGTETVLHRGGAQGAVRGEFVPLRTCTTGIGEDGLPGTEVLTHVHLQHHGRIAQHVPGERGPVTVHGGHPRDVERRREQVGKGVVR